MYGIPTAELTSPRDTSPRWTLIPALVLCIVQCSCSATPREQLQGRWYNEALSMRFRPDGSLIYNSTETGLTTGRYYFSGEMRPEAYDEPVANLTVDLVRGNKVVRSQLEAQFVGSERLRLQPVSEQRSPANDVGLVVLKRAESDGNAPLAQSR
jgi:hypothetical protein